ncbi:hypothetical protein BCR41DRAFT_385570 [Lobosporangium transversale]|uniref:Ubiquitin carboxyl-terminal hydrolase n=1 Tax=Lobosporangium transversale TaxID=64571 RepID=A0A1Y2GR33_9FUNG|nr:hypothetical protein BCR41DRAFT_385570 [Lobosporangium transversale]ORZ19976.1 hypothetical protein BCR41DRAFT_385570 [Lobosporangium transversale]|eukprot:XP_021882516.1 hypothetical protein BCR41DRAFT_385570 [Lobosporangium transversale]
MSTANPPSAPFIPTSRLLTQDFFPGDHAASHGCPHIKPFKKSADIVANYQILVRYSLHYKNRHALGVLTSSKDKKRPRNSEDSVPNGKAIQQLPTPACLTCDTILGRIHACLHCVFVGCWKGEHSQKHSKDSGHTFSMEVSRCGLYCNHCKDFIYDRDFEGVYNSELIRTSEIISMVQEPGQKRPRYLKWHAGNKEAAAIKSGTKLKPCQGLRGLRNMGSTCFMNVILQCFIHNPLLRSYFLSDQHSSKRCEVKADCMGCEMDQLFTQFYSGVKAPYGPCSFLHTMWMSSSDLAGYAQQDAHEFFISALNQIHAKSPSAKLHHCNCVIHKTFAGLLQSDVTCMNCANVTTAFDPILDISLDLRPTKRSKSNGNKVRGGNDEKNEGPNSLADCLDRYTHPEKLGTNEYNCSKCGKNGQDATKQLSIKVVPPVLSFQLKRFEHSMGASKIETKIKFPAQLDMTQYTAAARKLKKNKLSALQKANGVSGPESSGNGIIGSTASSMSMNNGLLDPIPTYVYNLFAVINHQGKMDTGHYTAFAKHRGEWFSLDDHKVSLASQKEVLDSKAYMLFYVKQTLDYDFANALKD